MSINRRDEIVARVLEEMKLHNIDDNIENRIAMIEGLIDGWREDDETLPFDVAMEKWAWVFAAQSEVMILKIKLRIPAFKE